MDLLMCARAPGPSSGIEGICPSWLLGADGGVPPVVRRIQDAVPWSLYSDGPLSSRPQPLGSGGDADPCEDTRKDFGLSFSCHHVLLQGGFF